MTPQNPNDPQQPTPGDHYRSDAPLDVAVPADPQLREGPASAGRIAIYAVAILILASAVFYGLNSAPPTTAANPPATTTADTAKSVPPNVRDVTPNREAGTTTGAAPAQPVQPPQSNPSGTQVDQNKGPANR